jgi:hypothetical protein
VVLKEDRCTDADDIAVPHSSRMVNIDLPDDRAQDTSGIGCRDGGCAEAILCRVDRSDRCILHALPDKVVCSVH